MVEPERRRRRPAVSCTLCRKRKLRCDREIPCSNCLRSRNGTCEYENQPGQPQWQRRENRSQVIEHSSPQEANRSQAGTAAGGSSVSSEYPTALPSYVASSSTNVSTPASQAASPEAEYLKRRIRLLEEQLSKVTHSSVKSPPQYSTTNIENTSRIGGTFYTNRENRSSDGRSLVITRGIIHKGRLFGQSHWMNGIVQFLDTLKMVESCDRGGTSKILTGVKRCKYLSSIIKSQWSSRAPSPSNADLPPKAVADQLVACYMRTTEPIYRVLHIPSFEKEYEAFWGPHSESNDAFLIQLKLVLAIGAVTYDERFSLRASAIQWVHDGLAWFSQPEFKSRLSLQYIQINILLLLAREMVGVGEDFIWVSAGSLVRLAIMMGLHRDPSRLPRSIAFTTELRRRLWNTILEITVQSSITSGNPPLLSLDDFDTELPGNFDDDQLFSENPIPQSDQNFTQMTVAIALRGTLSARLAIAKFLNNLSSRITYDELLRLDAELKTSYKSLSRTLQRYSSNTGPSPSDFQKRVVDFLMLRYQAALHVPFFSQSMHDSTYAFSHKVVVDTSLKIWYAAFPSSSTATVPLQTGTSFFDREDFSLLITNSSGLFRHVTMQVSSLLAIELRNQLQEGQESLGPVPVRSDLLSVVNDAKAWTLRCHESGETNIKGHLVLCLVSAHTEALRRGIGNEDLPDFLVSAAEEAVENCRRILEEKAGQIHTEGSAPEPDQTSWDLPPFPMTGWDFMLSDDLFASEMMQEPFAW